MVPDALCNYLHCLGSSVGVIDVGVPVPHLFRFPKNNTSSSCCQAPAPAIQRATITGFKDSDGPDELLPRTKGFISRDAPMPNCAWPPTALGRATPRQWQQWQVHPQLPLSLAQLLANQIRRHALTSHLLPEETSTLISETRQGPSGPRLMPEKSSRGPCEIWRRWAFPAGWVNRDLKLLSPGLTVPRNAG